ncbi:MAG: beta-galactosidase GalA [Capsulimonadaceae bacterium]|nr:beta-galactosidase GalA [Capsulimonadaceae bacterium]
MSPTRLSQCLLAIACIAVVACCPASARQRLLFDANWRFQIEPDAAPSQGQEIAAWRWTPSDQGVESSAKFAAPALDTSGPEWKDAAIGDDVFHGRKGFAWFRAILPKMSAAHRILSFAGVDDNADVFVNGVKLTHHEGWNDPFDVEIGRAWRDKGPNAIAVLVENIDGPGGIGGAVKLTAFSARTCFNEDFNDRTWRIVHLPHDYIVEGPIDNPADYGHGGYTLRPAWYRKTFTLPATDKGKSVWIDFDGVYRDASVYLNGQLIGKHPSGYASFRYDLTNTIRFGAPNVLAVRVNPRLHEGWWYEGGGIYRHVWLNIASKLHIAPWGTFVSAKLPEPGPDGLAASAKVTIETNVAPLTTVEPYTLVSKVFDSAGKVVAQSETKAKSGATAPKIEQTVTVAHPRLWSLETPYLYQVVSTILVNGQTADQVATPFGIRTIRWDADKGFFLNGKSVKIKGFCNHQDFAGVGIAVPDTLEAWRVAKLKAMGANGWRMSHNPPTPELLDACDKLGMLVMDETRHLGDATGAKSSINTPYTDLYELKSMIQRDRNHPSIVLWSMCNEEGIQGTPQAAAIFQAMMDVVHRYDTTRPISCAMNGGWFDEAGIASVEDLLGVNYSYGVYDKFHALHPKMPIYGSESASTVTTRGEYATDAQKGFVTSYNMTDGSWKPVGSRQFVAGSFAWTGFDYKGETSPFKWPNIHSNFGVLDMCGFPKDNYWYYQSWWLDKPIIHIMPHWNWAGKEGQNIRVIVFSNCSSVELFLNGASLGAKDVPFLGHLEWSVPYQSGVLEARGITGGKVIIADRVETTGTPASLRLTADRTTLTADSEDVIPVEVDVLDARGRIVPTASNRIAFTVTGPAQIAGAGNGNPVDHEPDTGSQRDAFNGKALVVVRSTDNAGPIVLTATADGLAAATLDLSARK